MDRPNGPQPQTKGFSKPHARLPTVNEAFTYSPFASIKPFNPNIIQLPTPPSTHLDSHSISKEDEGKAWRLTNRLDYEASHPQNPSPFLQQALGDVSHFLQGTDTKRYQFKTPYAPKQSTPRGKGPKVDKHAHGRDSRLGRFAELVLESNKVDYTRNHAAQSQTPRSNQIAPSTSQSNPLTSTAHSPNEVSKLFQRLGGQTSAAGASSLHHSHPQLQAASFHSVSPNSSQGIPSHSTPNAGPLIIIPETPSSNHSEYKRYPELDQAILNGDHTPSKKRKRDDGTAEKVLHVPNIDQEERAQGALQELEELMANVFEVEDSLPDASEDAPSSVRGTFILASYADVNGYAFSLEMMNKLHKAISKTSSAKVFKKVPVDQLSRLQKLFHKSVLLSAGLDLTVPEEPGETAAEEWCHHAEIADNGLRGARNFLSIISSGRDEKQLYSEEILQDLLTVLRQVLDKVLVPVAESRSSSSIFTFFEDQSNAMTGLSNILQRVGRVVKLLGDLVMKVDISDSAVNTIESMSAELVFVENATSEKESILGIQKFEAFRRNAMDVLARIFLRCPGQRTSIIQEILTHLEKLPVTRQSARQFKIIDGKPIQLVSALIMQLVQTNATHSKSSGSVQKMVQADGDESDVESDSSESSSSSYGTNKKKSSNAHQPANDHHGSILDKLTSLAKPLFESAQRIASYVANFLVKRALTSTKSGDQPYRNLLDIFTEDFVSVLGSTDWPAAEMMLRALLSSLIGIVENEKSAAPAKNMALDLIGIMGSGIADIRNYLSRSSKGFEGSEDALEQELLSLSESVLENECSDVELLSVKGPFRAVVEFLQLRATEDLQLQSARNLYLVEWAHHAWTNLTSSRNDEIDGKKYIKETQVLGDWLVPAIRDPGFIGHESDFAVVSTAQARIAYAMTVMTMPFCRAMRRIFTLLLTSLNSPHATVRSRSLKSVFQLLEKDPSILDRSQNVISYVLRASGDASTMVRDSALHLISRFLTLKPSLIEECFDAILARTSDVAVGVRKRSLRLLKDIYLQNKRPDIRGAIAKSFLDRVHDEEDSVGDMARQALEEVWIAPFYSRTKQRDNTVLLKQDFKGQSFELVATVQQGDNILESLEEWFKGLLRESDKNAAANRTICQELVGVLFDNIIENEQMSGKFKRQHILQTLTVFAKASPRLLSADHMSTLRPYIENLSTVEDLLIFRSVVVIYRFVLPVLPPMQHQFLHEVQSTLLSSVSKLGRMELNEVATCLWIIDRVLMNSERLVKLVKSVLKGVYSARTLNFSDTSQEAQLKRVKRYITIAGPFGKGCDLDPHLDAFKEEFSWWKGNTVSGLMVDILSPFSEPHQPVVLKEQAAESILAICQAWPKNFDTKQVGRMIGNALSSHDVKMELIVLSALRSYYEQEEARSKGTEEGQEDDKTASGAERLGKSMISGDNDSATMLLAQQYLSHVLRIAISTTSERVLIATEIIASVNRQGLVHPKECGPTLVALETSPKKNVAKVAFEEHKNLNSKHESILERDYARAIEQAFIYQRDTIRDSSGVTDGPTPKLHFFFEVLKSGNAGARKKTFTNMIKKLDFNVGKMPSSQELQDQLLYARFVCQNMALADYSRVDEILHIIKSINNIFSTTGDALVQRMDGLNILSSELPPESANQQPAEGSSSGSMIDFKELHLMTIATMILSLLWHTRTHLRSFWGLQSLAKGSSTGRHAAKTSIKETNKAPTRAANVSADGYIKLTEGMGALANEESMREQCRSFMEMHSTDAEAKVGSEEEDLDAAPVVNGRVETPIAGAMDDFDGPVPPSGGSGRGRKRKSSLGPNGGKKPGRPSLGKRKRSSTSKPWESDEEGWD